MQRLARVGRWCRGSVQVRRPRKLALGGSRSTGQEPWVVSKLELGKGRSGQAEKAESEKLTEVKIRGQLGVEDPSPGVS